VAEEKNITDIYYQEEMSVKQAKIVANELNGKVVKLTPLSADYIESQKYFIDTLVGESVE
jgi:ABC-type Zn uptake system ZnuABC Zn-binding protein ZnuA